MTTVAFPAGFNLDRSTTFQSGKNTVVDISSDGTPLLRTLNITPYTSINCRFTYLSLASRNTLVTFITDNESNTITWTIDGINYSGVILPGYSISMTGPLYNVEFTYYASLA